MKNESSILSVEDQNNPGITEETFEQGKEMEKKHFSLKAFSSLCLFFSTLSLKCPIHPVLCDTASCGGRKAFTFLSSQL